MTEDDGSGGGLDNGQPGMRKQYNQLMVAVSPSWLTVRGTVTDESGGESYGDVGLVQVDMSTVFD